MSWKRQFWLRLADRFASLPGIVVATVGRGPQQCWPFLPGGIGQPPWPVGVPLGWDILSDVIKSNRRKNRTSRELPPVSAIVPTGVPGEVAAFVLVGDPHIFGDWLSLAKIAGREAKNLPDFVRRNAAVAAWLLTVAEHTGTEEHVWGWEPSGKEWRCPLSQWPPENREGIPEEYFRVQQPPWKVEFSNVCFASELTCALLADAEAETDKATTAQADAPAQDAILALLRLYISNVSNERLRQATEILQNDALTVNEKLTRLDTVMPIPTSVSAEKIGRLLGVSRQAILQTTWWHTRGMKWIKRS